MKLTEKQLDLLNRRNLAILATTDLDFQPRAIIIEVNKVEGDRLVITDNEMGITRNNILANKKVSILVFESDYSYCLKLIGEAEYYSCGNYFDYVIGLQANKGRLPKGAVVVKINGIFEFK